MFWAEGMAFAGTLLLGMRRKRGKRHKNPLHAWGVLQERQRTGGNDFPWLRTGTDEQERGT